MPRYEDGSPTTVFLNKRKDFGGVPWYLDAALSYVSRKIRDEALDVFFSAVTFKYILDPLEIYTWNKHVRHLKIGGLTWSSSDDLEPDDLEPIA